MIERVRLPLERVGAAIGPNGVVKREIEQRTGTKLTFDTEGGSVEIEQAGEDPLGPLRAKDVLTAIARGFSPERAFRLFEDGEYFELLNLSDYLTSEKAMTRLKGRIIGERGKTRRIIEETSGAHVSVYGKTVALIGNPQQLAMARRAIQMLIGGAKHSTVYGFLERERREFKRAFKRG